MTNNKKGGYKVGTVISGAQSVDNNVVPVVSSGKNQSVNGQKFGDIMAKSVGGNAGKKNSSTDTLSQNSIRTNTSSSDKNDVAEKVSSADKAKASDTNKTQNTKTDNKVAEKVDKAANEVYDKIKKTLGVSDEEIQHSMENLGLTMVNLLMPENIMQLVMDITGTQDSMQLVTDDMLSNAMKDIMDFVSLTSQQLAADLSVTPDDLKEILQSVSIDEKADKNIQTHEENSDVKEDAADSNIKDASPLEQVIAKKITTGSDSSKNDAMSEKENGHEQKQSVSSNEHVNQLASGTTTTVQSIAEEFSSVLENRGVNETDILDQIINQIKFTSDDAVKSMEIQLTPETLGKVNVLVSVREGVVTAQLNVQNEQVKKALENQMITLKENFENQGVKVESVEITVQTNAFENNQNFNNQNEQKDNTSKNRAKLNLNGLNFDDDNDDELDDEQNSMLNENSSVEYMA